jgi:prevent-host-death family protein
MKAVGIRELKAKLSEYIRLIKAGEDILVTDRGEVVAEIRPARKKLIDPKEDQGLQSLARQGCLSLGGQNNPKAYLELSKLTETPSSQLLDEERGSR